MKNFEAVSCYQIFFSFSNHLQIFAVSKISINDKYFMHNHVLTLVTLVEGDPKAPFSIATKLQGKAQLLSLDYSTLPLIDMLKCWVLRQEASITIYWIFIMTRPGIEPRSPGP